MWSGLNAVGTETLSKAVLPVPGHKLCFPLPTVSQEPGRGSSPIPHPHGLGKPRMATNRLLVYSGYYFSWGTCLGPGSLRGAMACPHFWGTRGGAMHPGRWASCPPLAGSVSSSTHIQLVWSQVSHHPPSAAHHVFSKHGWSLWQEITIASKFRGKYISIMPLGELGLRAPWTGGKMLFFRVRALPI